MKDSDISLYAGTRFTTVPAPEWLLEAGRVCKTSEAWQETITRVLGCEQRSLNPEPIGPNDFDFSFWQTATLGTYVEIDSTLGPRECVLVPKDADWLPFMTTYLLPLFTAASQMQTASQLERLTNAAIAFMRHGEGSHIDRHSGRSQIDERRDAEGMARWRQGHCQG